MLPHLPKDLGVILAANVLIVLQDSFRKPGSAEVDIADDRKPR